MEYQPDREEGGALVAFWLNGFGPVKNEWGLAFTKIDKGAGGVVFHNQELGLAFPFFWDNGHGDDDRNALADVNVVRVVFPRYVERPLAYTQGSLQYNGASYPFEEAEDINQIAFKTLRDRMVRELSNSLLRVAVKQGIKQAASKQNEWLGFAVGIANALTEKADTRNWQTLPYMISYTRVPLGEGASSLGLRFLGEHAVPLSRQVNLPSVLPGKTHFLIYTTM